MSLGFLLCAIDVGRIPRMQERAWNEWSTIVMNDLAHHLALFSRQEEITAPIANQLNRLHNGWTKLGADDCLL